MGSTEIINLISAIASLVLSVLAIWLSLFFYKESKGTETKVASQLSQITAQTDALQKLTGRWMDRLTKHATDTTFYDTTFTKLIEVIKIMPTTGLESNFSQLQSRTDGLTQDAVSGFVGMYYYCATTNVCAQAFLPKFDDFDHTSETHNLIKNIIDSSYDHCLYLESLLAKIDNALITSNPMADWHPMTKDYWRPHIKDATQVFKENTSAI